MLADHCLFAKFEYKFVAMSVFQKLSDFVVETSEQALKVVEEGSAILMGGDSPNNNNDGSTGGFNAGNTGAQDNSNFIDELPDEYLENESPLNGLADNVLSDIIKNQVRGVGQPKRMQLFLRLYLYFHVLVNQKLSSNRQHQNQRGTTFKHSSLQLHGVNHLSYQSFYFNLL